MHTYIYIYIYIYIYVYIYMPYMHRWTEYNRLQINLPGLGRRGEVKYDEQSLRQDVRDWVLHVDPMAHLRIWRCLQLRSPHYMFGSDPTATKKKRMFKKLLHEPWIHGRCGTSVSGDWIPQHYKFMPVLNVYTHAFEFVLARAHPSIIYQITPIAANVPVDTGGSHLALPLRWLFSESTSLNGGRLVRIHSKEWGDMGTVIMASADEVVTERN